MSELMATKMSDIRSAPVSWLWPGRIPRGKVTLIAGDPGLGKSFLTMDIAARVTRAGTGWNDGEDRDQNGRGPGDWPDAPTPLRAPGEVVIFNAEDDAGDTLRPRLEAAGADIDRVRIIDGVDRDEERDQGFFSLDRDIETLSFFLRKLRSPRLVIIDPISAFMGATDTHRNSDVRAVLARLGAVAAGHDVAIVCVTHLSKSTEGQSKKAVHRLMGSLAFAAAARMVWMVGKHPDDADRRVMTLVKSNLDACRTGLSYRIGVPEGNGVPLSPSEREVEVGEDGEGREDRDDRAGVPLSLSEREAEVGEGREDREGCDGRGDREHREDRSGVPLSPFGRDVRVREDREGGLHSPSGRGPRTGVARDGLDAFFRALMPRLEPRGASESREADSSVTDSRGAESRAAAGSLSPSGRDVRVREDREGGASSSRTDASRTRNSRGARVLWDREPWTGSADALEDAAVAEQETALEEAERFLREVLKSGPVAASEVLKQAEEAGVSERTMSRVRRKIGIKAHREATGGPERGWVWQLSETGS